jgi:hypothetical protein
MSDEFVPQVTEEEPVKKTAKKRAPKKEAVTVLEVLAEEVTLTDDDLKGQIEDLLKRTAEDGVAFVSVPKDRATPELMIWLRDTLGCQTAPLNVNSNLYIKDHDARTRGGWVCHPTS